MRYYEIYEVLGLRLKMRILRLKDTVNELWDMLKIWNLEFEIEDEKLKDTVNEYEI